MAVAFDNSNAGIVTSTTIGVNVTVGSGANRAVLVAMAFIGSSISGITVSGGGASSWALVSGTDQTASTPTTLIWGAVNPSSGAQTFTASWTGSIEMKAVVATFSGVDQTTPFAGGTKIHQGTGVISRTVTAVSGDETVDIAASVSLNVGSPTQTSIYNDTSGSITVGASRADATGNMTHQWNNGDSQSACAVKQASASVTVAQYQNALDAQRNAPGIVGINHWWT